MLMAYYCALCNLLFWLHEDSIHEENALHLSAEHNGDRVRCPRCQHKSVVHRMDTHDQECEVD